MNNHDDQKKQEELRRQQEADRLRALEREQQAAAPKPVETAIENEQLGWLNQTKAPDFDVTHLNALTPQLSLYNHAKARADSQRMGIGALRMGMGEGDGSGLSSLLASQQDAHREQDAAGQLENAFAAKDADMRGSVMPLLGLQQNRTMGLAGLGNNASQNSTSQWASFRPRPSVWQNLLMAGVQGAAGVATGGVSQGGRWS
jgi:hypothetical protein